MPPPLPTPWAVGIHLLLLAHSFGCAEKDNTCRSCLQEGLGALLAWPLPLPVTWAKSFALLTGELSSPLLKGMGILICSGWRKCSSHSQAWISRWAWKDSINPNTPQTLFGNTRQKCWSFLEKHAREIENCKHIFPFICCLPNSNKLISFPAMLFLIILCQRHWICSYCCQ